jgi:hypothetical protein
LRSRSDVFGTPDEALIIFGIIAALRNRRDKWAIDGADYQDAFIRAGRAMIDAAPPDADIGLALLSLQSHYATKLANRG